MSRRKAREMALQVLFQMDFNDNQPDVALAAIIDETGGISQRAKVYAQNLVSGTIANLAEIDTTISSLSAEWSIERMAGVDRNIARMAIYEMNFGAEKLTPNVVINEAVELAKSYGSDDSSRFINGILGSLARKQR